MSQSDQDTTDSKKGANILGKDLDPLSGRPHLTSGNPYESDRHTSLDDSYILMKAVIIIQLFERNIVF